MTERNILQPLAILIVVVAVVLAGTFGAAVIAGPTTGSPDGENIQGQSPAQYQPDAVGVNPDPETGNLTLDSGSNGTVVVDIRRSADTTAADLAPIVEAMFRAGYSVTILDGGSTQGLGQALEGSDGLLIVQPAAEYPDNERNTIQSYVDTGGHVVVTGEPTRTRVGGGLFASVGRISFGASDLTESYGVRIGSQTLYNVNDDRNDNNFKSIYANPAGSSALTDGVETVNLDRGGYLVTEPQSSAEPVLTAAAGTRTGTTRRTGSYATAVRNGNMVVVADADVVQPTQLYDVDNEVFVGNMLSFLAGSSIAEPTGSGSDDGATGNGTVETAPGNETAETAAGNGTSGTPTDG